MAKDLLTDILKNVSRAFYTSLWILPQELRGPLSLGYLFCRAADTLADTTVIEPSQRLLRLKEFQEQFRRKDFNYEAITRLSRGLTSSTAHGPERLLLEKLPDCFHLLEQLSVSEQALVREVVVGVTQGMEMDLNRFPEHKQGVTSSLDTREELERYCFLVAGNPGSFWTQLCFLHYPSFDAKDAIRLNDSGVRLGKTLQLTNILRDIAQDLRLGRCYIPRQELQAWGIEPQDLLDPASFPRFRPVLIDLIQAALDHADQGIGYVRELPGRYFRLRLACAWPLAMSLITLALTAGSSNLLDHRHKVKMTRIQVYQVMLLAALWACVPGGLGWYLERLKQKCQRICDRNSGGRR